MSDDLDPSDLPDVPDTANVPDELASVGASLGDDEDAARKIGSHSSIAAMLVGLLLVGGLAAFGYVAWERNEAYDHRWDVWEQAQQAPTQAEFLRMIREDLPRQSFNDVRSRYLNRIGALHDRDAVPVLIPLLDEPGQIRADAARALAQIGSPAADSAGDALLRVLPTCDVADRAPVVWALAVLHRAEAADAIIAEFAAGTLQGQEGFDARTIQQVLGVARLSTPELTDHESTGVRTLVAQALAEAATPDVIDPLTHMIQHEQQLQEAETGEGADHAGHDSVIRACVSGLGRVGDPRAGGPLFTLMQRNPSMRNAVLDALRHSTGARGLSVLLAQASDDATRTDLVGMLRATHDPAAADALATQLGSADEHLRIEAASGLAEVGDARCVPVLVQLAQSESLETGRDALDMLMLAHTPDEVAALRPMLSDDRFLGRRASVLRVLGRSGVMDAGRDISQHLDGDDIASAAMALAELNYDAGYDTLMHMIPRPRDVDFSAYQGMAGVPHEMEYNNRTAAVRAIGRYGRPDAAEALMTIIEDPQDDIRLRNDAGLALGAVATDEIIETVIGKIQQTDLDASARRFYLGALWQHPSHVVASRLMELMTNPATASDVRHPAAIAIGYAADPANDARLIQLLDDENLSFDAAIAICLGGSPEAGHALLVKLGTDEDLRQSVQDALMNAENDFFNLVTTDLWDSGEVYRRMHVAMLLNEGEDDNRQGYAWSELTTRLEAGWSGIHGLTAPEIRARLLRDLQGNDADTRAMIAHAFGSMNELGLLMAARDAGGNGADEARAVLTELSRPSHD